MLDFEPHRNDWDSPPASITTVSSDPEDSAMDGRRGGSASVPFSEKLEAAKRSVSVKPHKTCAYLQQDDC